MEINWNDGLNSYKQHKLIVDPHSTRKTHWLTLRDVPVDIDRPYLDIAYDILKNKNKIDILYSGGQDSELLARTAVALGLNFNVITMKLTINDCLINVQDLYYSELFCKQNNIKQNFVELDVKDFFNNESYLKYLEPYVVAEPHIATHHWLLEQCNNFAVFAGDYSWPQAENPVLSPTRYRYCANRRFMDDHQIDGVSNFLSHSLDLNMFLIRRHREMFDNSVELGRFKSKLYSSLGVGTLMPRLVNYGWEGFTGKTFNKTALRNSLLKKIGDVKSIVVWQEHIKNLLESDVYSNDQY